MHVHTHRMTSLLEIAVYDRWLVNSIYNMSTKKAKGGREDEEKLMTIGQTDLNTHMFDFSITPADTKSFSLFIFLVYIINHRTIELRKKPSPIYVFYFF